MLTNTSNKSLHLQKYLWILDYSSFFVESTGI